MTVTEIPDRYKDIIGMGTAEKVFPVRRTSKWGSIIAALICGLGAGLLFLFGIYYTYTQYINHGPAVIVATAAPFLVFFIILAGAALLALWSTYANWKKSAVLYQNGFAYSDRSGVKTCRWDELDTIKAAVTRHYTNGVYSGTSHVYTIQKKDETRIVLNDSVTKVEDLANNIRERVFPLIYQRYSQAYNTGQPVAFGQLILSRTDGISFGKKSFPWDQVDAVKIDKGYVQIARKGGGWFSGTSIPAASIPNLEVMLSIVDQIIGVKMKQ